MNDAKKHNLLGQMALGMPFHSDLNSSGRGAPTIQQGHRLAVSTRALTRGPPLVASSCIILNGPINGQLGKCKSRPQGEQSYFFLNSLFPSRLLLQRTLGIFEQAVDEDRESRVVLPDKVFHQLFHLEMCSGMIGKGSCEPFEKGFQG